MKEDDFMLEWLSAHAATIVVSLILGVLLILALRHLIQKRKSGGCGGCEKKGCSACSRTDCSSGLPQPPCRPPENKG